MFQPEDLQGRFYFERNCLKFGLSNVRVMKFLIDIGYVFLASLLLAMIFLSFDYSFGQAFFLGTLFMPGAFALKYFIPQLSFSDRKKGPPMPFTWPWQ